VEKEQIQAVVPVDQFRPSQILDFGEAAILPGLIDPHVHINDPAEIGRVRICDTAQPGRRLHAPRGHASELRSGTTSVERWKPNAKLPVATATSTGQHGAEWSAAIKKILKPLAAAAYAL